MPRGRPPGSAKTPGSGRKAGTPNKATVAIAEACKAHGIDVVKELCTIIKDDTVDPKVRTMALGMLLDRTAPRLKSVEVKADVQVGGGIALVPTPLPPADWDRAAAASRPPPAAPKP